MLGVGGEKNWPKKYNIDYFGYAEFKFKLNFDQERGSKIDKKVKIQKKSSTNLTTSLCLTMTHTYFYLYTFPIIGCLIIGIYPDKTVEKEQTLLSIINIK